MFHQLRRPVLRITTHLCVVSGRDRSYVSLHACLLSVTHLCVVSGRDRSYVSLHACLLSVTHLCVVSGKDTDNIWFYMISLMVGRTVETRSSMSNELRFVDNINKMLLLSLKKKFWVEILELLGMQRYVEWAGLLIKQVIRAPVGSEIVEYVLFVYFGASRVALELEARHVPFLAIVTLLHDIVSFACHLSHMTWSHMTWWFIILCW